MAENSNPITTTDVNTSAEEFSEKSSNQYENLLTAVIGNDQKTIQNLLQLSILDKNKISALLWKILCSLDRRDAPYHLGVTMLRGVIEDWAKTPKSLHQNNIHERLFRSIISLSDTWKSMNACECPSVRSAVIYWHKRSLKIFAEKGMDLSVCRADGETLLHLIAFNRKKPENKIQAKKLIDMIINQGCDINAMSNNWTPLHFAVSHHRDMIVEIFIELGANVNAENSGEWPYTPLLLAILFESKVAAKMLIAAGANVNCSTKSGSSALYLASEKGDDDLINLLIERGANINSLRNGPKSSALHVAASEGRVNIVRKLIHSGANVNAKDEDGRTPLHYASQSKQRKNSTDYTSVVEALIKSKADVNVIDKEGNSPLHFAASSGSSKIVHKLLKSKAGHSHKNVEGMTALHVALKKRWSEKPKNNVYDDQNCCYKLVAELLIKAGKHVKIAKKCGQTSGYFGCLMYLASKAGDPWSVDVLIECGADINITDKSTKSTALHTAIKNNQVDVIDILIDRGAEVNVKDIYGQTPLHMTMSCSKKIRCQIILKLLGANARADLQDDEGLTPMDIMIDNDDAEHLRFFFDDDQCIDIYTCCRVWNMPSMQHYNDFSIRSVWHHVIRLFAISPSSSARERCEIVAYNVDWSEYYQKCLDEIKDMKTYLICNTVSLYEFLNMKTRVQCTYVKNIDLKSCSKKFKEYNDTIKYRYNEAVERKFLIQSARSALYKMTDYQLPEVCVDYILDFLRNIPLKALIECAA